MSKYLISTWARSVLRMSGSLGVVIRVGNIFTQYPLLCVRHFNFSEHLDLVFCSSQDYPIGKILLGYRIYNFQKKTDSHSHEGDEGKITRLYHSSRTWILGNLLLHDGLFCISHCFGTRSH